MVNIFIILRFEAIQPRVLETTVEVRVYKNSILHDRYIISDKNFWLCGNSLNYIGNKESFIVLLGDDIRQNMFSTYNCRWKIATPI